MKQAQEPVVAVVVAAGSGVRMGASAPKALLELDGRPLVRWSVEAMAAGGAQHVLIVVAPGLEDLFSTALHGAPVEWGLVAGGRERQDSVRNGLRAIAADPRLRGCRVVLVHDAARPLVPASVVRSVADAVLAGARAVIPVIPVVDTVRQVSAGGSVVVDRARLRAVQTPQGFDRDALLAAHDEAHRLGLPFTDDAGVCEAVGHPVVLVPGSRDAHKVTEPLDLVLAHAILKERG